MNKQQRLTKGIVNLAVISGGTIGGCLVVYFLTNSLLETSINNKMSADRTLGQDQSQVSTFSTQLDKSGIAEKRFLETQGNRTNLDYSSNTEALKTWLKAAIIQYRLSNSFKLSLTSEKSVENKELAGSNYETLEHPNMKVEFHAISDTHVFSFIEDLTHNAPGFFAIDGLTIKRLGDIDKNTIALMRSGAAPYLVDAQIRFNWIGLNEKQKKDAAKTSAPAGAGQ